MIDVSSAPDGAVLLSSTEGDPVLGVLFSSGHVVRELLFEDLSLLGSCIEGTVLKEQLRI